MELPVAVPAIGLNLGLHVKDNNNIQRQKINTIKERLVMVLSNNLVNLRCV